MLRYIIVRLGQAAITLVGVSLIVFLLVRSVGYPPDFFSHDGWQYYVAEFDRLGYDAPWYIHYFTFVKVTAQGDFGYSLNWQARTAMELVRSALPDTLQLVAVSIGVSLSFAMPVGMISAVKKGTTLDAFTRGIARLGQSIPPFLLGILLIWAFAVHLEWLPEYGSLEPLAWVLPSIALSWFPVAVIIGFTRASMLNALDSNYTKMARIKGIPEWKVVWWHSLANVIPAVLAAFPALAAFYLFNLLAIELVFARPGVFLLGFQAAIRQDYQVLWAVTMYVSTLVIAAGLLIDILRAAIDPRVRDGQNGAHLSRGVEMALP